MRTGDFVLFANATVSAYRRAKLALRVSRTRTMIYHESNERLLSFCTESFSSRPLVLYGNDTCSAYVIDKSNCKRNIRRSCAELMAACGKRVSKTEIIRRGNRVAFRKNNMYCKSYMFGDKLMCYRYLVYLNINFICNQHQLHCDIHFNRLA
jgi:hypothetical protein